MNMNAFKRELAFAVTTGFVFVLPLLCHLVYWAYERIEETGTLPQKEVGEAPVILLTAFFVGVGACLIFRLLWWSVATTIRQLRK